MEYNKDFLELVTDNIKEGITISDFGGNFLLYNKAMENITGYSYEELSEIDFPAVLYPDPEYREKAFAAIESAFLNKDANNQLWKITRKDGENRWVLISSTKIEHQGVPMILGSVRDITELKK